MRRLLYLMLLLATAATQFQTSQAQMAETIAYQGYLTDVDGIALDGTFDLTFRLYEEPTGGTSIWSETQPGAVLSEGVFSVRLGSEAALSSALFERPLFLSLAVGDASADELLPRLALEAVPYSLRAQSLSDAALSAGSNVTIERDGETLVISATASSDENGWSLGGNEGTDPSADYIGTSDASPLEIKVDGGRALRIEPATSTSYGFSPNLIGGYPGNRVAEGVVGAAIGGGRLGGEIDQSNVVNDDFGTIAGGSLNVAEGVGTAIGGGGANTARGTNATVSGGQVNTAEGSFTTIGGGIFNVTSAHYTTIGGGEENSASDEGATVAGGTRNLAGGSGSSIGGGSGNIAQGHHASVSGGAGNEASGSSAMVGGGQTNAASGNNATIGGGEGNTASGDEASTVGGGLSNAASGVSSTIAGGFDNSASSVATTVGGGAETMRRAISPRSAVAVSIRQAEANRT